MSKTANANSKTSLVSFSVFDEVSKKLLRNKILGIVFLIFGGFFFFLAIILVTQILFYGLIAIIPMFFFIFFGVRITNYVHRTGAWSAYQKVKNLMKQRDVVALKALTGAQLKDELSNPQWENYFQYLFSIAALIDLNVPNSTSFAVNFYYKLVEEKVILNDVITLLKALAYKEKRITYLDYLH